MRSESRDCDRNLCEKALPASLDVDGVRAVRLAVMDRMNIALVVGAAFALSSSGCAAVFKGSKQEVEFRSVPQGADVRVDSRYVGETPIKTELSRNTAQNIVVSKEGFKEQYVTIKRQPDTPWWLWDIATCVVPITLCIPVLVDAISGAWMSIDDEIRVKLDPIVPPREVPRATPPPNYPPPNTLTPERD